MWKLFRPWRRFPRPAKPQPQRRAACLLVEALESRVVPSTYYVSPNGDDGNPGISPDTAWQSIDKVNATAFQAGDAILFQGGAAFSGSLNLDPSREPGTAANPITISSYGNGAALIASGGASGLSAVNTGGLILSNLSFVGDSSTLADGLSLISSQTDSPVSFVHFDQIDVSGYRSAGIHFNVDAGSRGYGFDDVQITHAAVHNNGGAGIRLDGNSQSTPYPHTNFYIGHATVAGNAGDGINLSKVDGATVERSEVYGNGRTFQVGIVAAYANDVTIQNNEAYQNRNGIGFDADVANSFLQYNYTHDNAGSGIRISGLTDSLVNVSVRYNIAENNAQAGGYGISVSESGNGVHVFNNIVFASSGHSPLVGSYNTYQNGPDFRNNVFVSTGGVALVSGASGTFQGNAYWSSGGVFNVNGYSSLAAWRALDGQELLNQQPTGYDINPQLTNPGGGGTIGDPDQLASLTAYLPLATSPLIDAGFDLQARFGIDPGSFDFYGGSLPQYNGYDLGAAEYAGSLPSTPNAPSNLAIATASFRQVDLTWQRNSSNEAGFRIERSLDGTTFTPVGLVGAGVLRYSDIFVNPSTTYYYRVQAFNAGGAQASTVVSAVTPTPVLPPSWSESDIGGPFRSGFASQDPTTGTWTVAGGGTDIWNNADQFQFASGAFTGDGTLIARVTNTQNTDTWSKAGVMFRNDTSAGAVFVDVVGTYGQGVSFQWRNVANNTPTSVTITNIRTPVWVRLVRSGNNFSAYYSTNGTAWIQIGTTESVPMNSTARAGLAVTAHNNLALNTGTFTNVSLLPTVASATDIGVPALPGGSVLNPTGGTWTVIGAGSDIFGTADQFQFASQSLAGDGSITAQVVSLTNTNAWAKAGVMFRDSAAAGAMFADVVVSPGDGVAFEWRDTTGGQANDVHITGLTAPLWVLLVRSGNDFSGYYSSDDVNWVQIGATQTIAMSTSALAGLAVTSHNTAAVATAIFTNVSILPAAWGDADIGTPGVPGYVIHDAARGIWTITGGGADIWNTADQFHYLFQSFAGDGAIVARVTSVQNTNAWAKAGVMFRDTTDPGALFVDMLVTPGNGVAFQWRTTPNSVPANVNITGHSAPQWVMLVRAGNAFSGYYSSDGVNWIQVGTTQTVALSGTALAGLAVTAHDNTALSTATFTNVALTPAGSPSRSESRTRLVEVAEYLSPPRQQGNDLISPPQSMPCQSPPRQQGNDLSPPRWQGNSPPPSLARRAKGSGGLRIFSLSLFLTETVATIEG